MKVAIVDLGTKSVRFDIHQVSSTGVRGILYRDKAMVRLGDAVFKSGRLDPAATDRTIDALRKFSKITKNMGVTKMVAVATSALRDAADQAPFVARVEVECGIDLKVISGRQEAELILEGIMRYDSKAKGLFGFVDLGGGSTEIGICQDKHIGYLESLQLGSLRLQQLFFLKGASRRVVEKARDFIRSEVAKHLPEADFPKLEFALGASGTVKALAQVLRKEGGGRCISKKRLQDLIVYMIPRTRAEMLDIPGLEEKRVDLIIPGAVLLDECMAFLGIRKVYHTRYALGDGLLSQFLKEKN